ncbi:NAD-dependent epimerase/dehydratase family protein [Aureitalea marina]|uniref:NAD-dependent epimerase n=1 Tax=Aureitalea marina TaxID=930804 RepID=A0A2S7KSI6_9FLAO|nr:NAD-dependent epimerase/dehydratase family protein [Aureitalea marina]PQB05591.1 NAD-dependent epimerase [Aureitalea marina]
MSKSILVIGARGQIGTELTSALRDIHGNDSVIASDIVTIDDAFTNSGPFVQLDAMDKMAIQDVIKDNEVEEVYLMAAMLSATAEKYPSKAWDLNMTSLFNLLEIAKEGLITRLFWPSSIAVFGPTTPRQNTPQHTITEPSTVYGISKLAGERWCEYYSKQFGVDVRSIRYPGLISYKTAPGGGTTDYAIDVFHQALNNGNYDCFLGPQSTLPMMYMDDAIRATISIMDVPSEQISIRNSYNLAGVSFSPAEIASEIEKRIPGFQMDYNPDFRQAIADSWPASIDDSQARKDWNWSHRFELKELVEEMIKNLSGQQ